MIARALGSKSQRVISTRLSRFCCCIAYASPNFVWSSDTKLINVAGRRHHGASAYFPLTDEPEKPRVVRAAKTPGPMDSPSPSKKAKLSPGTSSLSDIAQSPDAAPDMENHTTPAKTDVEMDSSDDDRIVPPPPPVTQHTFFPDPLAPDPVIYHIREVTPGMTDEERKEIYSVRGFPTKDLSDQIAGTPPDKDFSNAKPTNQVAANTFLAYAEPYVRPLTEEDMAFLRERVSIYIRQQKAILMRTGRPHHSIPLCNSRQAPLLRDLGRRRRNHLPRLRQRQALPKSGPR